MVSTIGRKVLDVVGGTATFILQGGLVEDLHELVDLVDKVRGSVGVGEAVAEVVRANDGDDFVRTLGEVHEERLEFGDGGGGLAASVERANVRGVELSDAVPHH